MVRLFEKSLPSQAQDRIYDQELRVLHPKLATVVEGDLKVSFQ